MVALALFGVATLIVAIALVFAFQGDSARQADMATRVLGFGGSITGILYLIFRQERTHEKLDAVEEKATTAASKAEVIEQRTNGGLNKQVKDSVSELITPVCERVTDLDEEFHLIKHFLANEENAVKLAKFLREQEAKKAQDMGLPDAPPGTPGDRPGAGGSGDDKPAGG